MWLYHLKPQGSYKNMLLRFKKGILLLPFADLNDQSHQQVCLCYWNIPQSPSWIVITSPIQKQIRKVTFKFRIFKCSSIYSNSSKQHIPVSFKKILLCEMADSWSRGGGAILLKHYELPFSTYFMQEWRRPDQNSWHNWIWWRCHKKTSFACQKEW